MSEDFHSIVLTTLARIEAGQAKLEAGQVKLEASQAALAAGHARLEAGQAKLEAAQARLEAEVADIAVQYRNLRNELLAVRTAVMDRIDRLQNALTETRGDLGVNMGGLQSVWRQIAADRDAMEAMRDSIAVLQRQVRRLQERDPS